MKLKILFAITHADLHRLRVDAKLPAVPEVGWAYISGTRGVEWWIGRRAKDVEVFSHYDGFCPSDGIGEEWKLRGIVARSYSHIQEPA